MHMLMKAVIPILIVFSLSIPASEAVLQCPGKIRTDFGVYRYPEPAPVLPRAGEKFCDPVFGTTLLRVTDERDGPNNTIPYSYWPSLNRDNSRILVFTNAGPKLYSFDPVNFRITGKRKLFVKPAPGGRYPLSEDAIWSDADPKTMYAHEGSRIWAYHVVANKYTRVAELKALIPGSYLWQMSKSSDDNTFAFTTRDSVSYEITGCIVWRRRQGIVYQNTMRNLDEVQIDKSGNFLLMKLSATENGIESKVVNLQNRAVTNLKDGAPDFGPGHSDNGNGTVIGHENWMNRILRRNLTAPHVWKSLLRLPSWEIGMHLSMISDNEDWALVSTFDSPESGQGVLRRELFQISTDGMRRVRRFCHHHSVFREYEDSPRANISRDGSFVVFTSNWGSTTRRDVFIVALNLLR